MCLLKNGLMFMEYKGLKTNLSETECGKTKKMGTSRLVIEENTIYEIDLDCQYRKQLEKQNCKSCNAKKGV